MYQSRTPEVRFRPSDVDQNLQAFVYDQATWHGNGARHLHSIVEFSRSYLGIARGERGSVFHFTLPANGHEG